MNTKDSSNTATQAGLLEGIRVVDFTVMHAGPYATAMLADLGAEVIHVEPPKHGDLMRGLTTLLGLPVQLPNGQNILFEEIDRNKKGIALDLKKPQGMQALIKLIKNSDVFVSNYRERVLQDLQLDYESVKKHKPNIIYGSLSGLGRKGPDNGRPSIDIIASARSGAMLSTGEEGGPPVLLAAGLGDRVASVCLAFALVSALFNRERNGNGQEIHVSQLGTLVMLHGTQVMPALLSKYIGGRTLSRHRRKKPTNAAYNFYECKDGRWIAFGVLRDDKTHWQSFCSAMGAPELFTDPDYCNAKERAKNGERLAKQLCDIIGAKTSQEWASILSKTDILWSPINDPSDLVKDSQVVANNYITDYDHPTLGKIKFVGFPYEFTEQPARFHRPAPQIRQDTEEVLTEICGYSWEDIGRLRDEGVI